MRSAGSRVKNMVRVGRVGLQRVFSAAPRRGAVSGNAAGGASSKLATPGAWRTPRNTLEACLQYREPTQHSQEARVRVRRLSGLEPRTHLRDDVQERVIAGRSAAP